MKNIKQIIIIFLLLTASILEAKNNNEVLKIEAGGSFQLDNIDWWKPCDDYKSGYRLNNVQIKARAKNYKDECLASIGVAFSFKEYFTISDLYGIMKKDEFSLKFGKMDYKIGLEDTIAEVNRTFMQPVLLKSDGPHEDFYGLEANVQAGILNVRAAMFEELMLYQLKKYFPCYSIRGFINPNYKSLIQHLGGSYKVIYREKKEKHNTTITDLPPFDAPTPILMSQVACLPETAVWGIELIEIWKAISLQGEATLTKAYWKDYDYEYYKSAYIQFSIFLTGESYGYDFNNGVILNPMPKRNIGAFELAFRYNYTDMTHRGPLMQSVSACDGKKTGYTIGMNWYASKNAKLQINFTRTWYDHRLYSESRLDALGIRTQFEF